MAELPGPNVEIELKLSAPVETIEALSRSAPVVQASEGLGIVKTLENTYYDTPDLRLLARGIALRVRKDGERFVQTMKTELESGGTLARRGEWETPVGGLQPDLTAIDDADARELLGLILPGELQPVFSNRVRREVHVINSLDESGHARTIEIAVDIGETRAGDATEPIAEIELELLKGSAADVFDLALALHRIGHVRIEPRSKAERGYALSTDIVHRWQKAETIVFNPQTTIDEALAEVFNACFKHWTANESAALDGRDPEGIHQMRVGLRRLRSALSIFGPLLPEDALAWLKEEASDTLGALGRARDLDVFLGELLSPVAQEFRGDECLVTLRRARGARAGQGVRAGQISYCFTPIHRIRSPLWWLGRGPPLANRRHVRRVGPPPRRLCGQVVGETASPGTQARPAIRDSVGGWAPSGQDCAQEASVYIGILRIAPSEPENQTLCEIPFTTAG